MVERFAALNGMQGAGQYSTNLTLDRVPHAGLYILSVRIGADQKRYKVNVIK